jgi:hypothetical protein
MAGNSKSHREQLYFLFCPEGKKIDAKIFRKKNSWKTQLQFNSIQFNILMEIAQYIGVIQLNSKSASQDKI